MTDTPKHRFQIRKALLEDAVPVSNLGRHVFTVTFGWTVQPHQLQNYLDAAYSIEATQKDIIDPQKDLIVATAEDESIVGFALMTRGTTEPCVKHLPHCAELQRLYVHPDHHGKGIGKNLGEKIHDMAREEGFQHIWLGVWEDNHAAQKVYQKLGYELVGDHAFDVGGDIQTDLIMVKTL